MEKTYTLRELQADDLFAVLNIINKIGINEVKALFASAEMKKLIANLMKDNKKGSNNDAIVAVGMQTMLDIACLVCTHLPECKSEIYEWLASLAGVTVEELAKVKMNVFISMIRDVFQKDEFKDFFQQLAGLLK